MSGMELLKGTQGIWEGGGGGAVGGWPGPGVRSRGSLGVALHGLSFPVRLVNRFQLAVWGEVGLPPTAELLFQFAFLGTIKYLRPW